MTDLLTAGIDICSLRASCFGFLQDICESGQKIVPVATVLEYSPSFNAPNNNVMEGSGSLPAIASSGEAGGHLFMLFSAC
jgi:hypothetical protein